MRASILEAAAKRQAHLVPGASVISMAPPESPGRCYGTRQAGRLVAAVYTVNHPPNQTKGFQQ
jgi:hypothetical protein